MDTNLVTSLNLYLLNLGLVLGGMAKVGLHTGVYGAGNAFRKVFGKLLGSHGVLFGGSMFQTHCRKQYNNYSLKNMFAL